MKNLKIGVRLGGGFAAVLLLLTTLTVVGIVQMQSASKETDALVNVKVRNERLIGEWTKVIEVNAARTAAAWKVGDPEHQKQFEQEMAVSSARATEIQNAIGKSELNAEEQSLYQEVLSTRKAYTEVRKNVFKAKNAGDLELGKRLYEGDMVAKRDIYLASLKKLELLEAKLLDETAAQIRSRYENGRLLLISLGVVAILLGIACAYWITRSITRPITRAVEVAQAVSAGDLTSHIVVESRDETGQLMHALKNMNDKLVSIVGQVRAGTESISTASSEIAAGNLDLSSRTEEQASSLEETASSMEELTSTVKLNADNARSANQLAIDASQIASKGGVVVSEVVSTMGSINDSSRKIVDIISVIDAIAFQTNILALNAAVEAARAGEQGRGFAVVASEVRNLAQRSSAAAKEIKGLIDDSVQKVEAGSQLVDKAGRTMDEIVQSISHVTQIMNQITDASDEQRTGIEQVNRAIGQMDQVTQQNAALVEEAAAAAESMQEQAAKLADVVGVFKLDATQRYVSASAGPSVTASAQGGKTATRPAVQPAKHRAPAPAAAAPAPGKAAQADAVRARAPKTTVASGADDWEEF
ncbi:methyl-accepting chemotaxis protein I [Janthinobacterium sp. HH103]|uniref:methyl-accepting chemotaxis protein n=1 Tax=unclassified Janthinobacterium TaxID=2610881 RepID=UPI000874AC76|nr:MULTISPECIES: methyl-accepting chemotaxis protein [unclassified Janthinobacterium]OEZ59194.1 methyl-accepting chemotaxis protein I [Janthinobacterium sp. HH100]OEZ68931.1 methyl-accepting chemotaxis protein I [Janthinobacterium sp. HH103]QOU74786.1 Methyl-accepting chemotaxis protein (MCP) signaling domain protein [Janthinobacterium sp. HH102]